MKTHLDCPDCKHHDCLTEFDDGNTYCHSCGVTKNNSGKTTSDLKEEYNLHRGILPDTNKFYGVTSLVNKDKEVLARKYPYPHAVKYRFGEKDFSKNKGFRNTHLFGMDKFQGGQNQIVVVEGEEDTMSAYQLLGCKVPVVGLPGATPSKDFWDNVHSFLNSFKEIVVIPDADTPGQAVVQKMVTLFPNKVFKVSLTKHKDANDFLKAGDYTEFRTAYANRSKCVPDFVYNSQQQFEEILDQSVSVSYLETPIVALNDKIKGLMQGHFTVITGYEGEGKTEILRWLEWNILKNHPEVAIASCHLEESKNTYLRTLACYELNKNVRDPDSKVPVSEVKAAIKKLTASGNLYLFDFSESEDPMTLLERIRYFATVHDVKMFFIDPIQQLAYAHDSMLSDEQTLSKLSVKLEKLCTDLDIGVVMTTHVNDDGQVRSSRMIAKSASVRIDLVRKSDSEDEEESNTTYLKVTKNRPMSRKGFAGKVLFDPKTFTLKEVL